MDKSMTGDGAVVRADHEKATAYAKQIWDDSGDGLFRPQCNLARAYLAQAAEIERLTREVATANTVAESLRTNPDVVHINMLRGGIAKPSIRQMLHLHGADALAKWDRAEASEASTAALLKALKGLLSPDKMSVYGTMDKIAAATKGDER